MECCTTGPRSQVGHFGWLAVTLLPGAAASGAGGPLLKGLSTPMTGVRAGVAKGPTWLGLLTNSPPCGRSSVAPCSSPELGEGSLQ